MVRGSPDPSSVPTYRSLVPYTRPPGELGSLLLPRWLSLLGQRRKEDRVRAASGLAALPPTVTSSSPNSPGGAWLL